MKIRLIVLFFVFAATACISRAESDGGNFPEIGKTYEVTVTTDVGIIIKEKSGGYLPRIRILKMANNNWAYVVVMDTYLKKISEGKYETAWREKKKIWLNLQVLSSAQEISD